MVFRGTEKKLRRPAVSSMSWRETRLPIYGKRCSIAFKAAAGRRPHRDSMTLPVAAYSAEVVTSATKAERYGVFGEGEYNPDGHVAGTSRHLTLLSTFPSATMFRRVSWDDRGQTMPSTTPLNVALDIVLVFHGRS